MKIYAMFGTYRHSDDTPELFDAWDEYTRDGNEDGYEEAREKWATNPEVSAFAVIALDVDEQAVRRALHPAPVTLPATVVDDRETDDYWQAEPIENEAVAEWAHREGGAR